MSPDDESPPGRGIAYDLSPGRRRLLVAVMMAGLVAQGIIFGSAPPILGLISQSYGGGSSGELTAQMTMGMPAFGLMAGGLLSGWILARTGVRLLLIASLIAFGICGAAPVILDGPTALLAGRLLTGFAAACLTTSAAALVTEGLNGADRARIVGYQAAWGGGISLASIYLSGLLVQRFSWQSTFAMYAVFAVLILVAVVISVPPIPRQQPGQDVARGALSDLGPVSWLLAVAPAMFVVMGLLTVQLPFLLREDGVTSPGAHALIIGMFIAGSMTSSIIFAPIQKAIGSRNILPLGLALLGAGLLLVGLGHGPITAGIGAGLGGLTMGITAPHLWHTMMSRAPLAVRGLAFGLLSTAMYLGSFVNPFIMAFVQKLLGLHASFTAVGGVTLLALLGTMLIRQFRPAVQPRRA